MLNSFLEKLIRSIKSHNLLSEGDSVIVALSGGADSVALLYSLVFLREKYALKLYSLHINHGIRGTDADADEEFSRELSRRFDVEFFAEYADIPEISKFRCLSVETAGRAVRYEIFKKYAEKLGASRVATGHHMDDQAETILMRLIRGTGSGGFKAIRYMRDQLFIRPLLDLTKIEIMDLLLREGLPFREDLTNRSNDYFRNKVRNRLIPGLEEMNPRIKERLVSMSRLVSLDCDFADISANKFFEENAIVSGRMVKLPLKGMLELHGAIVGRVVKRALSIIFGDEKDIEYRAVISVCDVLYHRNVNRRVCPGSFCVEKNRNFLSVLPAFSLIESRRFFGSVERAGKYRIGPFELNFSLINNDFGTNLNNGSALTAFLNADLLSFPLVVRSRQEGDYFIPLGCSGRKKLKKFLIDEKIPREDRDGIPLLIGGGNSVAWVIGYRVGEPFKVTAKTKKILKIDARRLDAGGCVHEC